MYNKRYLWNKFASFYKKEEAFIPPLVEAGVFCLDLDKFELYCMVFYVLDTEWDENKNPQLGEFLSGANPFLFDDIGSADPTIYEKYCEIVDDCITVENSYSIASKYIAELGTEVVSSAFSAIDETEWVKEVKNYLSSEHKGRDAK